MAPRTARPEAAAPAIVADLMRRDVVRIAPSAPLRALIDLLHESRISGVPVVDEAGVGDPDQAGGTSMAEGVAVDAEGSVYTAEVGPRMLRKYVRR